MGCTASKPARPKHMSHSYLLDEHLLAEDHTGVTVTTTSEVPQQQQQASLNDSYSVKSTLDSSKDEQHQHQLTTTTQPPSSSSNGCSRTKKRRQVTSTTTTTTSQPETKQSSETDTNHLHDSVSGREPLMLSYQEGLQVTVQPDNANMHSDSLSTLNNSFSMEDNSNASFHHESSHNSSFARRSRRNGGGSSSAARRRPASTNLSSNPHLSKARERMSKERRKGGHSLSPNPRSSKRVLQELPAAADSNDLPPLLMGDSSNRDKRHTLKTEELLDLGLGGRSGSSCSTDLGYSAKSNHSNKSNRSAKSHPSQRTRKSGGGGQKHTKKHSKNPQQKKKRPAAIDLENSLSQVDTRGVLSRDNSEKSWSSRRSDSKRSNASARSAKSVASAKSNKSAESARSAKSAASSPGRSTPRKRKTASGGGGNATRTRSRSPRSSQRQSFPANEPRKSTRVVPKAEEPEVNDPEETKAPTAPAVVVQDNLNPPTTRPTMPLSAPSQSSLIAQVGQTSTHSTVSGPSAHSQGSLQSYLPQNMKAHPNSPKWMQYASGGPSFSSLPSLASFSTLSVSDSTEQQEEGVENRPSTTILQALQERNENSSSSELEFEELVGEENNKVNNAKPRRSMGIGNLVQKMNPLKIHNNNRSGFEEVASQEDSEAFVLDKPPAEERRRQEQPPTPCNKGNKLTNAAKKVLSISNHQHKTHLKYDDKEGDTLDLESTGDESELSFVLDASGKDNDKNDPIVFKFDSSDPNVAQFDPFKAEQSLMNNSSDSLGRVHKRQSVRGKRHSTRRQNEEQASLKVAAAGSLQHGSSNHHRPVDALKSVEALRADASPRRMRPTNAAASNHGNKKRRAKSRSRSMPINKPRGPPSTGEMIKDGSMKDDSMKDGSAAPAATPSTRRTTVRRHTDIHKESRSLPTTPSTSPPTTRRNRRSTHHAGSTTPSPPKSCGGGNSRRLSPKPKKRTAPVLPASLD